MADLPTIPGADKLSALSKRELVVLRMVGNGLTVPEIASTLKREESTIRTHIRHMMGKLEVRRSAVLVRFAVRAGVVGL